MLVSFIAIGLQTIKPLPYKHCRLGLQIIRRHWRRLYFTATESQGHRPGVQPYKAPPCDSAPKSGASEVPRECIGLGASEPSRQNSLHDTDADA